MVHALLLGLLFILCHASASGRDAPSDLVEQLPDFTKPSVAIRLKCSSCKVIVGEIHSKLHGLARVRRNKPKTYEIMEAIEGMCSTIRNKYGLLMRRNKPTEEFSADTRISRLTGNWINTYIETQCGELFAEYEDEIIENFSTWAQWTVEQCEAYLCYGRFANCRYDDQDADEL